MGSKFTEMNGDGDKLSSPCSSLNFKIAARPLQIETYVYFWQHIKSRHSPIQRYLQLTVQQRYMPEKVTTTILNLLLFSILVTWFISSNNQSHSCKFLWTFSVGSWFLMLCVKIQNGGRRHVKFHFCAILYCITTCRTSNLARKYVQ